MTVNEAIERATDVQLTEAERTVMTEWLSELEARISQELYGAVETKAFDGADAVLSVPDAYAEIYVIYLMMKRELKSGDADGYGFYRECFKKVYKAFSDHLNRTRSLPKKTLFKTV